MIHDLQAITAEPDRWRYLSAQTEARDCSPLQCYVERRLNGEKGAEWLDGQSIEQAVRTTEMLGGLLAYGPSQKAKDMTDDMWDTAGRAAWPLVTKGDAELRELLSRALLKAVRMNGHPSPRNSFGMLYGWLFSSRLSKDPGPIRDIVREVIIENVPLVPGQMLLGTPVATPRLASIAAIAGAEGLHSKTLRNVLELAGVLDGTQPLKGARNVVADYALAKPLIERAKHTTPVMQVPDMLSASRPMVSALIELGKLTRIQDHDALKSKVGKAIDGRSIRQVLCFLQESFEAVKHPPEGHVHLAKAAEKTRVTMKVILELLFGLHLKTVCRLKGHHGFSGVLVSPDEVRACMANPPDNVSDEIRFWMG
ncbi:hypothetical protein [Halocynthiibacter styelae]|uniref:Uncharacterized protein n=1 Tax=Halocynthiibacter styelae TaxID=2761955 RepID=A0A8J7IX51_9RHOB|nr:hypothetical protein [Paenihalocynthiibacter styelae]MBI1494538.1 hypothetical protein [Paenihalocynthiibacter styelae]